MKRHEHVAVQQLASSMDDPQSKPFNLTHLGLKFRCDNNTCALCLKIIKNQQRITSLNALIDLRMISSGSTGLNPSDDNK